MMLSGQPVRKERNALLLLCLIFAVIALPRMIFHELDHGDEYADANILTAGRNFVVHGFVQCRFLEFANEHIDDFGSVRAYTHYPPLNDILNGLWRVVFRTDSLLLFRGIALFFSLLGVIFWFLCVRKLTNSYVLSWLAAVFYMTNPVFIYGMDALHQCSYAEAVRSMLLYFFVKAHAAGARKRTGGILVVWALLFIESLLTFEYIIYFALFFILYRHAFKSREQFPSWKVIAALACAPVCAFLLHLFQNAWYFGSFALALRDLQGAAVQRIAHSVDAPAMTFLNWWQQVLLRNISLVFFLDFAALFLAGFLSYLLYRRLSAESKKSVRPLIRLFVITAVCGISWYVVFPSHSWAHAFIGFLARHLLPAAAAGFAIVVFILIRYINENPGSRRNAHILLVITIGMIIVGGIGNSQLPVTPDKIRNAVDFAQFKNCLRGLKGMSRPQDTIGINYYRFPFIRYYTERDCVFVPDRGSLESLVGGYPAYFVLLPYLNKNTQELYEIIQRKYDILGRCTSANFPAILFKLKQ